MLFNIFKRSQLVLSDEQLVDLLITQHDKCGERDRRSVSFAPNPIQTSQANGLVLATYGRGKLLPREALLALLAEATKRPCGFAATPNYQDYCSVLAAKSSKISHMINKPSEWMEYLLSQTPGVYLEGVRGTFETMNDLVRASLVQTQKRFPINIVLETGSVCNLSCPICPRMDRVNENTQMPLERAKAIIAELASQFSFTLYPYYLGEPLSHKGIFELLEFACSLKNVTVNLVSNGLLLDEEKQNRLLSLPVHSFHFSLHECDTALQKGAFIHPASAKATGKVLRFVYESLRIGNTTPIEVSMVPATLDDPHIQEFKEFWLNVVSSVNVYSYVDPKRALVDSEITKNYRDKGLPCLSPWTQPVIAENGAVIPCCWDYNHSMVMGNVFKESFDQIWFGEKFSNLRTSMLSGSLDDYPICKKCDKWATYLPSQRAVKMEDCRFSSNGAFLSFQSLDINRELIKKRIEEYSKTEPRTIAGQATGIRAVVS